MTRNQPNSTWSTGRGIPGQDTIDPIQTGFWNDSEIWDEAGKFWWDGGGAGLSWTGRTKPVDNWS